MELQSKDAPTNRMLWSSFLKDVFICSLGAYGGPEAHFGVFTDQLVNKKKYLTEVYRPPPPQCWSRPRLWPANIPRLQNRPAQPAL